MKKSSLFAAASIATASTIVTGSNINIQTSHQDDKESSKRNSSSEKNKCCSEKFAPRFDGLRFIETLVTAHR